MSVHLWCVNCQCSVCLRLWQSEFVVDLSTYFVGHRGSVVVCATYMREIVGLIPGWAEISYVHKHTDTDMAYGDSIRVQQQGAPNLIAFTQYTVLSTVPMWHLQYLSMHGEVISVISPAP